MRGKLIFLLFYILIFSFTLLAADVKTVLKNDVIGKDEYTVLKIRVSGADEVEPLDIPSIKGLDIDYAGAVQTMEIVNFKSWSGIVLQYKITPQKTGTYTIRNILFSVDGKKYLSKPVTLKVVKGRTRAAVRDPFSGLLHDPFERMKRRHRQREQVEEDEERLIIKPVIEFKRKKYLVGEPIILKYYFLYNDRDSIKEFLHFYPSPTSKGFVYKRLKDIEDEKSVTENGIKFIKKHIGTFAVIPTASGNFKLKGSSYILGANVSDGFFTSYQRIKQDFPDQTVSIIDIPVEDKSGQFKGLLGDFSISVDKSQLDAAVYTESILKVIIRGKGNFYNLIAPDFNNLPGHIKVIKKQEAEEIFLSNDQLEGSRKYEYILIPEKVGEYKLGNLAFVFYSPDKRKFLTAKSQDVTIKVNPAGDKNQNRLDFDDKKGNSKGQGITVIQIIILGIVFVIILIGIIIFIIFYEKRKYNFNNDKEKKQSKKADEKETELNQQDLDRMFLNELINSFHKEDVAGFLNHANKTIAYLKKEKLKDRPDRAAELDIMINKLSQFRYGGGKLTKDMCVDLKDLLVKLLK